MSNIAIIGGSGFKDYQKEGVIFLPRHGEGAPPHTIDHHKNIRELEERAVDSIIGIFSVGSVRQDIKPGTIVIPHDFNNLFTDIPTFFNEKAKHIVPVLDKELRDRIINSTQKCELDIVDEAVYFQTRGPRFETPSEVHSIQVLGGDIVGMTMGSEATLARELGIQYAALCVVDNYANGVTRTLEVKDFETEQKENKEKIIRILDVIFA
ncbi:MAG: MTAP family purine nucleoside phosphorylase [Patescibacteria group bacterium]